MLDANASVSSAEPEIKLYIGDDGRIRRFDALVVALEMIRAAMKAGDVECLHTHMFRLPYYVDQIRKAGDKEASG